MDARKADTRNKIQLGGLIVKAGLGSEQAPVLLGILLAAAKALSGPGWYRRTRTLAQSRRGRLCGLQWQKVTMLTGALRIESHEFA